MTAAVYESAYGARNGHAEVSWRCPLLGEQRKTFARIEPPTVVPFDLAEVEPDHPFASARAAV